MFIFITLNRIIVYLCLTTLCASSSTAHVLNCKTCTCTSTELNCEHKDIHDFTNITFTGRPLEKVILKQNRMTALHENAFQNVKCVTFVDLSLNAISHVPRNMFSELKQLKYLNISFNKIKYSQLPEELFYQTTNLLVLSLNQQSTNETQANPPCEIFRSLGLLKELHITGTPSIVSRFENLTDMSVLNLGGKGCLMSNISVGSSKLLFNMKSLTALSLRNCGVNYLQPNFTTYFPHLKKLDLSCNPMLYQSIEEAMASSERSRIEVLLLDRISQHNSFTQGIDFNKVIPQQGYLQALSINCNSYITKKTISLKYATPNLKYLGIATGILGWITLTDCLQGAVNCQMNTEVLFWSTHLRFIDLSYLTMVQTPCTFNCEVTPTLFSSNDYWWNKYNDTHRYSDNNVLGTIISSPTSTPNWFEILLNGAIKVFHFKYIQYSASYISSCHNRNATINLEELDRSYMRTYIPRMNLVNCSIYSLSLKKLTVKGCALTELPLTLLHGFPSLLNFDISQNHLGQFLANPNSGIILNKSTNLKHLDVSVNMMPGFLCTHLQALPQLESLNASYNQLKYWSCSMKENTALKALDISNNAIAYFTDNAIERIHQSASLLVLLKNNAFLCGCNNENVLTLKWLSTKQCVAQEGITGYMCSNINESVSHWIENKYQQYCYLPPYLTISLSIAVPIVFILFASFIGHVKRYTILFWIYNCREKLLLYCLQFSNKEYTVSQGDEESFRLYLAVSEPEVLVNYLVNNHFGYCSRNNSSRALGYRWANVVHDIESCTCVVMTLHEGCIENEESKKDFYFALEKKFCDIIILIVGDTTSLKKSYKPIRTLISKSTFLKWDSWHPNENEFNQLLTLLAIKKYQQT